VWRPVIVLAVGLVLASAAAIAAVARAVAAIPASMAFVLGAVLASTDPVAVSALGRRLSLPPRVQALVQAESLFNDATSLVLFQIAVSIAVAAASSSSPDRRRAAPRVGSVTVTERAIEYPWGYAEGTIPGGRVPLMCGPAACERCKKITWTGCGEHAEQALAGVTPCNRCTCRQ
jgi:hypothetical protein